MSVPLPLLLDLRLDIPLTLAHDPSELRHSKVSLADSAFRLSVYAFDKWNLTERNPRNAGERLANIGVLTPLALLGSFANHEMGHYRVGFNPEEVSWGRVKSMSSGGFEQSALWEQRLVDTQTHPHYASSLLYLYLHYDNWFQRLSGFLLDGCESLISCRNVDVNPHKDPFELESKRAAEFDGSLSQYADYDYDWTSVRDIYPLDEIALGVGAAWQILDPTWMWNLFEVMGGNGAPAPDLLPQLQYFEGPDGQRFSARSRIHLQEGGGVFVFGAAYTFNALGADSVEGEIGVKNLVAGPLLLDVYAHGLANEDGQALGYVEASVVIPLNNSLGLRLGANHKFGEGYLFGADYGEKFSFMTGLRLSL